MSQSAPVTIVMIEDDEGHARIIEKNIRRAGINNELTHFTHGQPALDFLFGMLRGPALVLLDLNLPDLNGVEILARVKSHPVLKRTPVIVLTTVEDSDEITRCYDLGCNCYIKKPVNFEAFSQAILQLGLMLAVIQVPETAGPVPA
ncbi:response regulator [Zavarzinia sp. CC-PAN008]|uniref:response regulator n=1 Tax=Zavarzinia sp. CC-PAN008 TaxID=3243332 RepID=UPI003F7427EC